MSIIPRKTGSKAGRKRKRTDRGHPPLPIGRPSTYLSKAHDALAYLVALQGGSLRELGRKCDVPEATIRGWLKKYPNFSRKWEDGKNILREKAYESLLKKVEGFEYNELEERIDDEGRKTTIKRQRYCIPDTAAISIILSKLEGQSDTGVSKLDEILDHLKIQPKQGGQKPKTPSDLSNVIPCGDTY